MSRVGNIFELLSDENDEGGVRPVANTEGGQKKQEQPKAKTSAAPAKPQQPRGDRTDNRGVKDARPPRSNEGRPNITERKPREAGAGGEQAQGERRVNRPPRQQREGSERRGKMTERTEGEGAPRKRVFDRKSGTGRGPKDNTKRGGSGKGNWGTVEDDKKAQTEQPSLASEEKEVKEEGQEQAAAVATETENKAQEQPKEEEVEEEDNTKTLGEYLKSKKAPAIALPPPRQVAENNPAWANYVPLKREDEDDRRKNVKKDEKEESKEKSPQVTADQLLNFTTEQPKPAFGGRRGGRREFKGPKGGKKSNTPAPNFKDEKSFPSLSGAVKV